MSRTDKSRVMRLAHREWKATKHKPGMTFGKCLSLAWKIEKARVNGREHYNVDPDRPVPPAEIVYLLEQAGRQLRGMLAA